MNTYKIFKIFIFTTLPLFFACEKKETHPEFSGNEPKLSTIEISNITENSVNLMTFVLDDGGDRITVSGICWSEMPNPTVESSKTTDDGPTKGKYTTMLSNLTYNTTYYLRAYAKNSLGITYGDEVSFTTTAPLAKINTLYFSDVTEYTANAGGHVLEFFETVTEKGVCYSTSSVPTIDHMKTLSDSEQNSFSIQITDLQPGTTYYYRAYTINSGGVSYGEIHSFTTEFILEDLVDIDGNVYPVAKIGNQVWTTVNLKVTKFRNGDPIPNVTDNAEWSTLSTAGWADYFNDPWNANALGRYYNWHAVNDPRGLAPVGWRIPTIADFEKLNAAGTAAIELFNPVLSGMRDMGGGFWGHQSNVIYWTSQAPPSSPNAVRFEYKKDATSFNYYENDKRFGFIVRLVKE